jgi:TonB family protein
LQPAPSCLDLLRTIFNPGTTRVQFNKLFILGWIALTVLLGTSEGKPAQINERRLSLAVLDFGDTTTGRRAAEILEANLKNAANISLLDHDQVRAAARGASYAGSINLSLDEARELGAALGSEFFLVGDAQTLRRSPSSGVVYFESYASVFVVSARTGRLVAWERPVFEAATAVGAEDALVAKLRSMEIKDRLSKYIQQAHHQERGERELSARGVPIIEEAPGDEKLAEGEGLRLPRPYRRLTPPYPESAAKAEAEATVDVLVDLDTEGEVTRVEVARWAGFGLDEATVETVRRLHFFPAKRNGVAIPLRVLLRYNFRKPPRE